MSQQTPPEVQEDAKYPPGTIAYLADGGALVAVRVDGVRDGKLVTHSIDNKERRVSPRRFLWTSAVSVDDLKGLAAHWGLTAEAADGWDAEGAWTYLADQDQLGPLDVATMRARLPDAFRPTTDDALVLAVFDDPIHFRMRSGEVHPTTVKAMERRREEAVEAAQRAEALERTVGAMKRMMGGHAVDEHLAADVDMHLASIEAVALRGQEADPTDVATTHKILEALDLCTPGDPRYPAFEALRRLGIFTEDENLGMRREGLPSVFQPEVLAAAEETSREGWARDGRKDFTGLYTVAIDAHHTTEVDDAFGIEGNRLVIFIADAAALIPSGSPVDEAARQRISTLYLPGGVIPMLPSALGQASASLMAGEDRPVLAISFRLDPDGALVDFELEEAVCRLDARISYDEADGFLRGQGDGTSRTAGALMRNAQRMMQAHRQWRIARGALQLQRSEVDIEVAPDGTVEINAIDANGPARQLVSEMMISACAGVAQWCVQRNVPSIYRCQARPTEGGASPKGQVVNPAEQAEILRRLQPTNLTTEPGLHYTLALDAYIQISSPLRRYSDLVMHRQLKAALGGEPPPMDVTALRALCQQVERQTGAVRRVEYETRRYWTLKYLAQHPTTVR
ncbi:MAG: ribonuclease catalytic domain-containing protein, partial [Myxococcota bacterium]|nr:ribonuclease catalytic domain-containing protein [Myxococcota bacterium]